MATINVSQEDFDVVATALYSALDRGNREEAVKLDKIARKISAALSKAPYNPMLGNMPKRTWQDVPSLLDTIESKGQR